MPGLADHDDGANRNKKITVNKKFKDAFAHCINYLPVTGRSQLKLLPEYDYP